MKHWILIAKVEKDNEFWGFRVYELETGYTFDYCFDTIIRTIRHWTGAEDAWVVNADITMPQDTRIAWHPINDAKIVSRYNGNKIVMDINSLPLVKYKGAEVGVKKLTVLSYFPDAEGRQTVIFVDYRGNFVWCGRLLLLQIYKAWGPESITNGNFTMPNPGQIAFNCEPILPSLRITGVTPRLLDKREDCSKALRCLMEGKKMPRDKVVEGMLRYYFGIR